MSAATLDNERGVYVRDMSPERSTIKAPKIRAQRVNDPFDVMWFHEEIGEAAGKAVHGARMEIITPKSAKSARNATQEIAYYFRREFGYDFPQYSCNETGRERDRVILLTQTWGYSTKTAVGAICFRWREWKDAPPGMALAWLWLHPYLRGQGILSAYWPLLRKAYGAFHVEPPISPAMQGVLRKMGECPRCGVRQLCSDCRGSAN